MQESNEKNARMQGAKDLAPFGLERRLMEEINILRLEGSLFCFDPKEARRRGGVLTLADVRKQPVSIEIHPNYGQPSVLAYKVLQAIFLKLTEDGCQLTEDGRCLYNDTVTFSARELALLSGRSWSGRTSTQLHQAIMQLRSTLINASLYDKGADRWEMANFQVLTSAYFAGRGETITRCAVRLAPEVIASLNRRHVAFFNLHRLSTLDTLGLVLYKRVFFHLSNLMHESKRHNELRLWKDYETICKEWVGGLKPLRHKSKIVQEQLGRHLDTLAATGLIRRYAVEKNAAGDGFNIVFWPGKGFFEDYQHYYLDQKQPRLRFRAVAELEEVKTLELVAHFHRQLGRLDRTQFEEHETAFAGELLASHNEAEIRDLIGYAVQQAAKTKFDMLFFNALKRFVEPWAADRMRTKGRERQVKVVESCPFCNEAGFLELKEEGKGRLVMHPCPHQLELVTQIEERLRSYRV
ncbi:MAG: replication initiator protein A [Rhodocyclaceae bacterium]|nr:replication initiator protein A [Rhodocyclaceae bacterium]